HEEPDQEADRPVHEVSPAAAEAEVECAETHPRAHDGTLHKAEQSTNHILMLRWTVAARNEVPTRVAADDEARLARGAELQPQQPARVVELEHILLPGLDLLLEIH